MHNPYITIYDDNLLIMHNNAPDDAEFYVEEIGYIKTEPERKQVYNRGGYCIHYIIKGKALFNGVEVSEGQGYLMAPKGYDLYISDKNDPYEYAWIIVGGKMAKYFLKFCCLEGKSHIFKNNNTILCGELIKDYVYKTYENKNLNLSLMGLLYEIMSFHKPPETELIFPDNNLADEPGSQYVKQALQMIHYEYDSDLSICRISERIHVSQNYLCRLFNKIIGCSPQSYITKYRIGIAKDLLEKTDWKVGIISETVGYMDALYFSQIFRKIVGVTPTQYRKNLNNK